MMSSAQPQKVLLVDDDDAHRCLLARVLRRAGIVESVIEKNSLTSAREYLSSEIQLSAERPAHENTDPSASTPQVPTLVIVDLNLRDGRGTDLIAFLRQRSDLAQIPVIVLSTSALDSDIQSCKTLGAHDYVVKLEDLSELGEKLRRSILTVLSTARPSLAE